ncbi:histidine phosphatase family protein [Oceaniglobus roseus]|uniref:histidine phosphatase family protein n=1 Tax=Oceaniglobus roseus TaxID=1737570 RepID=UPI000C7EDD56|nr:histidine phosphatase family protein [Kandeliimicrobium roseum]
MGEIVLVRHGQANSAADNEADYDRLSDLGKRQAGWLGEWFRERGEVFDAVRCGTLLRQRQTAAAMGHDAPEITPGLDEMDYFNLGHALKERHGIPLPGPDDFPEHLFQVMHAWHAAEIAGNESFADFESRVTGALKAAAQEGRRVLCVTSAGVIGMALRHVLRLDPARLSHVLLPIENTSVHRFWVRGDRMLLAGYNAVPHMERADRADSRTNQ